MGTNFIEVLMRHFQVGKVKVNRVRYYKKKTVPIIINDIIVHMKPDSGADVNAMNEHHYMELRGKSMKTFICKRVTQN